MAPVRNDHTATNAPLTVLVIGGGGRDHALCHAFSSSPRLRALHAAPGNAGIAAIGTCHPVELDDPEGMLAIAREVEPDLVVVGAEDLLVAGLATRFTEAGFTCLGPSRAAAHLEGSKTFSKELMERAGVATPAWRSCTDVSAAHVAVDELGGAVAVKADGLAAGCGAFVCPTPEEARAAIHQLMVERVFGDAGSRVIIEQLIDGDEASVMAIVDGQHVVPLPAARDYKRLGDDDSGPNTGGMGAHAPSTDLAGADAVELARQVIQPIVDAMRADGREYRGVVYAGVMLTAEGPQVLEYNCRFGNPETQSLVRVLGDADLLDLLHRAAIGDLAGVDAITASGAAVAVCVAAEHYPELQYEPAPVRVSGLDAAGAVPGVELFVGLADAGSSSDEMLALGGRVVTISAWGADFPEAIERAYRAVDHVELHGSHHRSDIGRPALAGVTAGANP